MPNNITSNDCKEMNQFDDPFDKQLFLTEKQVRSSPGFEDSSDEEVISIINSLHQLSLITYELVTKELNEQRGF